MKLELKHLAPYLPYGLNIQHNGGRTVKMVETRGDTWHDGFTMNDVIKCDYLTPLLIPMEDIREGIKTLFDNRYPKLLEKEIDDMVKYPLLQSYFLVETLIESHADIFGLIEKGLAFNINNYE